MVWCGFNAAGHVGTGSAGLGRQVSKGVAIENEDRVGCYGEWTEL